jgi:hypothetical protein
VKLELVSLNQEQTVLIMGNGKSILEIVPLLKTIQVIMMFPLVCFSFILMQYAGGEVITLQKGKEVYCATKYRAFK